MGRMCGEPDEIKKNAHPKQFISPLFFMRRPDALFLSEVWFLAKYRKKACERSMEKHGTPIPKGKNGMFNQGRPALAEDDLEPYAGDQRGPAPSRTKSAKEDGRCIDAAFGPGGCFSDYTVRWSLTARQEGEKKTRTRRAGTAMLVRKGSGLVPRRVATHLPADMRPGAEWKIRHNEEGRVILAEFATVFVLHTYTPNNGASEDALCAPHAPRA